MVSRLPWLRSNKMTVCADDSCSMSWRSIYLSVNYASKVVLES